MNEQNELLIIHDWKSIFKSLGFVPSEFGAMKGRVEGIDISAIEDPLQGVCVVTATHIGPREASQFDSFISKECSLQMVGKLFIHIIEQVYPEKRKKNPEAPKPLRERPSVEEALAKVPHLMGQFYAVLDEMSFLFQWPHLMPEGYLDRKIGEVLAAYVYGLELSRDHFDCSEAKSSDGRSVQVKATRAQGQRDTVALQHACEHLLVVQLWGREIVEVYNGPLEPIWEACKKIQKDGARRISMSRLRGHNKNAVPTEQRIEPKRTWMLDPKMDGYDGGSESLSIFDEPIPGLPDQIVATLRKRRFETE